MAEMEKQYDDITAQDFEAWANSKVTQLVIERLSQKRDEIANYVLGGGCNEAENTHKSYAFHSGQIRGLNELFFIFEESKDEAKEEARKAAMNYDH